MSVEHLRVPLNRAFTVPENGMRVSVRKVEVPRAVPGPVAKHEAAHVVASPDGIESATIIPSGSALGTTKPKRMTPAAAGAAAAMGHEGVGWDLFLAERFLGVDAKTAVAHGRAALSGKEEELHEVATVLEERGTIFQADVDEASENVRRRRRGIYPAEISIQSAQGELQVHELESYRNNVSIPREWLEPAKAA